MPSLKRSYAGAIYARRRWRRDLRAALVLGAIVAAATAAGIYFLYLQRNY